MITHRYKKDPGRDAICVCGQGRAEMVHRMLVWRKAPTGNWLGNTRGEMYRCRPTPEGWLPELAANPDWLTIGPPLSFAKAKEFCEQYRDKR